jgi:hypothetical protein
MVTDLMGTDHSSCTALSRNPRRTQSKIVWLLNYLMSLALAEREER